MSLDGSATTVAEPGASTVEGGATTVVADRQDGGGLQAGLLERLDRMQAELLARTEAAAAWQARAELLAAELGAARQQLALMAPKQEEDEDADQAVEMVTSEDYLPADQTVPPDPPRGRWSRFWRWGVAADE